MSRPLRFVPLGGALVEITINIIQGRYLLRPDKRGRVNELVLGVVGRAQRLYSMSIVGISVLSSHAHVLAVPEDAEQMAGFMRHVGRNISDEIGRLHDWPGKMLERRYRAIQVSNEEADQIGRLRYLLGAGVKEQLVERAIQWPGVHSARALTRDHSLRGWWFDRSKEFAARRRGEPYGRLEYATEETVVLDPLPCWRHLPIKEVRRRVLASGLPRALPLRNVCHLIWSHPCKSFAQRPARQALQARSRSDPPPVRRPASGP